MSVKTRDILSLYEKLPDERKSTLVAYAIGMLKGAGYLELLEKELSHQEEFAEKLKRVKEGKV